MRAIRLRHQRLHRQADPAEQQTHTKIGQYTAPKPDVAAGDRRPTNQVSVAFSTACTALLSMKGKASTATAR